MITQNMFFFSVFFFYGKLEKIIKELSPNLFVLRFYGPVNPMGSFERGQFT